MKSAADALSNLSVSIYHDPEVAYPDTPPYSPGVAYPEYSLRDLSQRENRVYDAVRSALLLLGLDRDKFGTARWDPFGEIIEPGNTVVIKPNFVLSHHDGGGDLFSVITHPSVIRAIIDYVHIALRGRGRIIIADAPQMDCNFGELLEKTGLESIREVYARELGFNIEVYDLRDFWFDREGSPKAAYVKKRHRRPGDPLGGLLVNLGKQSLFHEVTSWERFYGADYDRRETIRHHHGEVQEYLVSRTVLSADAVISVPKLKVHKKVGVTLNIKGLVGTTVNKNYLVHYRRGTSAEGGDELPDGVLDTRKATTVRLQRWASDVFLARKSRKADLCYDIAIKLGGLLLKPLGFGLGEEASILDGGNWYGNDSAWRMAVDLLRLFLYTDRDGNLRDVPGRRMFSIVDGVVGGEGNGPLAPDSKKCGLVVAGFNPGAVDLVCARLMGFDYRKVRMLDYVLNHPELFKVSLSGIRTFSHPDFGALFDEENRNRYFDFAPHPGWKGHIEIE